MGSENALPPKTPSAETVERRLDQVVADIFRAELKGVAYHYTDWQGAEGILKTQMLWSTAHDCTNDEAEVVTADEAIIDVAMSLRERVSEAHAAVLTQFVTMYPQFQIAQMTPVYLSCFSFASDDRDQWCKYGDAGRGLCLGVRILDERGPSSPHPGVGSFLVQVEYSEARWRDRVRDAFEMLCGAISPPELVFSREAEVQMVSALCRIAAMQAVRAKAPQWSRERELRLVTLSHKDAGLTPAERVARGKTIRYLPVRVRDRKPIALAGVVIGPNDDAEAGVVRVRNLLRDAGYRDGDVEYPLNIVGSEVQPCEPDSVVESSGDSHV